MRRYPERGDDPRIGREVSHDEHVSCDGASISVCQTVVDDLCDAPNPIIGKSGKALQKESGTETMNIL